MIAYGPVPSRRLGRSLGINNIPPKTCSYACAYCQVGATSTATVTRQEFHPPGDVVRAATDRVREARSSGEAIDFISFVPDGEPTLDIHLGMELEALKEWGIPLAVISNGTLLGDPRVRAELAIADFVSIKVDAVDEPSWRKVDRPHRSLRLDALLEAALRFRQEHGGVLATETLLVRGVNDSAAQAEAVAAHLVRLKPDKVYLSVPTRPPAQAWVAPPEGRDLLAFHQILSSHLPGVEWLIGYEGSDFAALGSPSESILGITAVHPMREAAVRELLNRAGAGWDVVENLLASGELRIVDYGGHRYVLRRPRAAGACY